MAGEQTCVRFTIPASGTRGEFNDALYFDPAVYALLVPDQIEAAKQARYTNWMAQIDEQNRINRDPAVIALRAAEAATANAAAAREALAGSESDAVLTQIIATVVAGARTPADVRARLVSLVFVPIPVTPGPIVAPRSPLGPGPIAPFPLPNFPRVGVV